jgi:hypothetical protein
MSLPVKRFLAMVPLFAACSNVEPGSTFDVRLTYDGTRHDAVAVFADWVRPIVNDDPVLVGGTVTGDPQVSGISLTAADHITYDVGILRKPGDDETSLPLDCFVDEAALGHTVGCTGSRFTCSIVLEERP